MGTLINEDALSKASSFMIQAFNIDNSLPDMTQLMGCDSFNDLTVSDSESINYPNLDFKTPELAPLKVKLIPAELQERIKELQCSCQMGLFAEINRAWISIDNEIYLWAFDNTNDIAYYDGLNEVILTAALAKPKPNVFQPHISYVLCLASPVEIVLLGVSLSKGKEGSDEASAINEINIVSEPLFTVSVDNVLVSTIACSSNGRIFYAGKDGHLYEIDYQGDYSWFGKRSIWKTDHSTSLTSYLIPKFVSSYITTEDAIVQICIDEVRKCLYTRSSRSNIELFYLGKNGNKMTRIAYSYHESNLKKIFNLIKSYEVSKFSTIKSMCIIPAPQKVQLMAVTHTGVRLYFTTKGLTDVEQHPSSPPNTLTLVHVRLPPAFLSYPSSTFNASSVFLEQINLVHYTQGTSLMISSVDGQERGSLLWVLSTDLFPLSTHISESYDAAQLVGQVWNMQELKDNVVGRDEADSLFSEDAWLSNLPSSTLQIYTPNLKFAVVTSLGVCVAIKMTMVDKLQYLLSSYNIESEQVHTYFKTLQDEAMVNCLNLIISSNIASQQVSSMALKAYHLYKWSYQPSHHVPLAEYQASTPMAPMHGIYNKPTAPDNQWINQNISYTSANHRALYIFTCRLLRPVWFQPLVTPVLHKNTKTTFLASRLKTEQIVCVLQKVASLRTLLQSNPSLLSSLSRNVGPSASPIYPPTHNYMAQRNVTFKEELDEGKSLKSLELIVDMSAQLLGLWKILSEHQLHVVSSKLPPEKQQFLVNCSFNQLVLESQDICKSLVTSLLELYIEDNAVIDVVSARLQKNCPIFYSSLDQAFNKGNECINVAKSTSNITEKDKFIDLAIKHYKAICSATQTCNILSSPPDLATMCAKLALVSAYKGIVELVVIAANTRDPNNLALHYYLNSKSSEDLTGEHQYRIRLDCYKSILETLNHLQAISHSCNLEQPEGSKLSDRISNMLPSIFSAGSQSTTVNELACQEEAEMHIRQMMLTIVKSEDRLCEYVLFRWMVDNNMLDLMLELRSPHMEEFLQIESILNEDNIPSQASEPQRYSQKKDLLYQKLMMDTLAKFYMKEGKFVEAAKVLDSLALKLGNHIDLMERLNLMTRASLCLQSTTLTSKGHLLHEVQDKIEVIMLQMEIMKELQKLLESGVDCSEAIDLLNTQVYDVSELYTLFATPYDLSKCKLSIIRCSGHMDATLVQSLWSEVLNKELSESAKDDGELRVQRFASFLVSLGKDHRDSENYFPLSFLVNRLEKINVIEEFHRYDVSCVSASLLKVGVDIIILHDLYYDLYLKKDAFWKSHGRQFHLVEVDCSIMSAFVQQYSDGNYMPTEKRRACNKLLASISTYLVDLHSEINKQEGLVTSLKQNQVSLERLQNSRFGF